VAEVEAVQELQRRNEGHLRKRSDEDEETVLRSTATVKDMKV
jgi:hypothetical protein